MLKSKKLKRVFSIVMTSVFCMIAFAQTLYADEYALKGTIKSALEIMGGTTPWTSQTEGQIDIALQSETGDGAIFTAYKLLNIENQGGVLKVKIPDDAKAFWDYYTEKSSATVNDIKRKINSIEGEDKKSSSIIEKFVTFGGTKPAGTTSTESTAGQAKITTEFGFYAILQTGAPVNGRIASAPVLACLPMQDPTSGTWLSQFTIKPKDDTISVTKKVHASDEGDFKDETITNIGDTVTYEIIAELPEYGTDIVNEGIIYNLTDTLPPGVTIDEGTLKVKIKRKGQSTFEETTLASASYDSGTRTITLSVPDYKNQINGTYSEIQITYNAVLNKEAVIEGEGNPNGNMNTVTLEYSSKVGATETTTADAKVYTMGLDIKKVDKDNTTTALAGAEFEVHKQSDGLDAAIEFVDITGGGAIQRYRVATQADKDAGTTIITTIKVTDNETNKGMLMIDGLDNTKYYIKETKAPSGYNISSNLVEVDVQPTNPADYNAAGTLAFDGSRLLKEITNSTGIDLPVTGGMGTIIFTVIGLLLMAGAAYFLFFGRQKNAE